jgi:hypothetical protein
MRAVDPRLLRRTRSARQLLGIDIAIRLAAALLIGVLSDLRLALVERRLLAQPVALDGLLRTVVRYS